MEHATAPRLETQWGAVTPVLEAPIWSRAMSEKLRELRSLPLNWDSYGASPIADSAVQTSLSVIGHLRRLNLPEPIVVPVPDGGVQFEWQNERCELEVEVRPDKTVEFLVVDRNGKMLEGRISQPESIGQFSCLARWFAEQKESVDELMLVHASTN